MFGSLKSLGKAIVKTATIPAAVVADAITLGGAINDEDKPYTAKVLGGIAKDIKDIARD